MTENDQPRPDLDAAIDAVVPALTQVSDETVAASLRRTRIALAEAGPRRAGAGAWLWALPAVAITTILVAVILWHPRTTVDAPQERVANPRPSTAPAPLQAAAPAPMPSIAVPPRPVRSQPLARATRVEATSAPRVAEAPRPDPLADIVRAVQQIPEEAWSRTVARAEAPLAFADVSVTSFDVTPLDTPSLDGVSSESEAPGEP